MKTHLPHAGPPETRDTCRQNPPTSLPNADLAGPLPLLSASVVQVSSPNPKFPFTPKPLLTASARSSIFWTLAHPGLTSSTTFFPFPPPNLPHTYPSVGTLPCPAVQPALPVPVPGPFNCTAHPTPDIINLKRLYAYHPGRRFDKRAVYCDPIPVCLFLCCVIVAGPSPSPAHFGDGKGVGCLGGVGRQRQRFVGVVF